MNYRPVHVCGEIPESKGIEKHICESAARSTSITWGDLQRLCAKFTQEQGCALQSKDKATWAPVYAPQMHVHTSKPAALHMRSDALVNIDMSRIARRCLSLFHATDKCNVLLTIKRINGKQRTANKRAWKLQHVKIQCILMKIRNMKLHQTCERQGRVHCKEWLVGFTFC